ncbi:MAG: BREX-2 system phosphatase PglZ [Planctomycetes bacterium]|nr:BREX-2 system phosphatase PglZ [Planctomycetota bacterium]
MTSVVVGEAELKAHLQQFLRKTEWRPVIALRTASTWNGPSSIEVDGVTFDVVACSSTLAVRESMAKFEPLADTHHRLVVLTDVADRELGDDVLAHVAKGRGVPPNRWAAVPGLFGATNLDPSLTSLPWLADALIRATPSSGYPKVPSGWLDEETAWNALCSIELGLQERRPDLAALLAWSLQEDAQQRFDRLDAQIRSALPGWWARTAGPSADLLVRALRGVRVAEALPLGLAMAIIYAEGFESDVRRREAAILVQSQLGGEPIDVAVARAFGATAERVYVRQRSLRGSSEVRRWLDAADEWVTKLRIDTEAYRSDYVPKSMKQRQVRFAEKLKAVLVGQAALSELELLRDSVVSHADVRFGDGKNRDEYVRMAVRLARWWSRRTSSSASSWIEAVRSYARDGAFVDRAREALRRTMDVPEELNQAVRELVAQVSEHRTRENERFASLLAEWTRVGGALPSALVPIEEVLDRVVTPIGAQGPVFLLVIDGLSLAAFEELVDDFERYGFSELRRADGDGRLTAIGVLPTVTEACRTSLLCGALRTGDEATERSGFASHPGLRGVSTKGPPLLFHKAALKGSGGVGLADDVRAEVAGTRRVVGVVLNAVDDHLLKGDQSRFTWTIERISPLPALLEAARESKRTIIVTADHGHVLHHESRFRTYSDGGERWRGAVEPIETDEVRLAGPRVLLGSPDIVAPWSESLRYGGQKNGYHGGATPQEVLVPVAIWSAGNASPNGFVEVAPSRPDWWSDAPIPSSRQQGPSSAAPPTARPRVPSGMLFDTVTTVSASSSPAGIDWVSAMLASKSYAQQLRLAGRAAPAADRIRATLEALANAGCTLTRAALSRQLDLPLVRLNGVLTQLRKILNVDGYDVLSIDGESDTVRLDLKLLETQFELGGDAGRQGSGG